MALGLLASAMYISCIFHVVCALFSALATRKLADAEANSSGIWALLFIQCIYNFMGIFKTFLSREVSKICYDNLKCCL